MKRWNCKECLTRKIIIPILNSYKRIKRTKLKICLEELLIPTKNTFIVFPFTCQSKYVCHYLCLISLMSCARSLDIVNIFIRLFFLFVMEYVHLIIVQKSFLNVFFFSFCHEIFILNNRLKVIFEWVFFDTGNIATSHFFGCFPYVCERRFPYMAIL